MGNQQQSRETHNLYDEQTEHFIRRGNYYRHKNNDTDTGELPPGLQKVVLAAGCFWGTEKSFWRLPGVYATAVGYIAGDDTVKPTYRKVCSGKTGHAEATLVIYDPAIINLIDILRLFFSCHDPTQGDGQGNDRGSQYRSGIYVSNQRDLITAQTAINAMNTVLSNDGYPLITTELQLNKQFWYAESYHQCYLAKPGNRQYCSAEPTGRRLPEIKEYPSRLPTAFWGVFDFSIRAPNQPMIWTGGKDAIVQAQGEAKEQRMKWEESKVLAEQSSGVVIRFCGGCGYAHRAKELQEYLDAAIGLRPSLLRDDGVTGNFDVSVRLNSTKGDQKKGSFQLIHSKKIPLHGLVQDGFVDTIEKLERILRDIAKEELVDQLVLEGALNGRTAFPRSIMKPLGSGGRDGSSNANRNSAKNLLSHWTQEVVPLVMFGKTWCKHCQRAKQVMLKNGYHPFIIWMDQREDESEIQMELRTFLQQTTTSSISTSSSKTENSDADATTGVLTVPQIFANGLSIGGADAVEAAILKESLDVRIKNGFVIENTTVEECWKWMEEMSTVNKELMVGVEYDKFMGEMEGGIKILRPPKRNELNRDNRPML